MKRTTGLDNVANKFTDGNPVTPTPATEVDADFLNTVQEEISSVIEGAGLALDQGTAYPANDTTQLKKAIQKMIDGGSGAITAVTNAMSPYTLVTTKKNVPIDTSAGNVNVVLPDPASVPGAEWHVGKTTSDANHWQFTGYNVGGEAPPIVSGQYDFRKIKSMGTLWIWS